MKNITDEQIRSAARLASKGIFTSTNAAADFESGWNEGAEWMKQQLEDINVPQSAEVMSLIECQTNVAEKYGYKDWEDLVKNNNNKDWFIVSYWDMYASQYKAKSEALQAELNKYQWISVEPRTKELTDRMNGCDSRLVQCLFDTGEILAFNDDHPFAVMTHVCFLPSLPSATKEGGSNG